MRDRDCIIIDNGDEFTIERDDDGYDCIRIENAAWVEEPRFIGVRVTGKHDRAHAINQLIWALTDLRDGAKR